MDSRKKKPGKEGKKNRLARERGWVSRVPRDQEEENEKE